MRSVEPLYSKITNPTTSNNGRSSLPSIQELYKGLSLSSQFKVSLGVNRTARRSGDLNGHLTRCGIFDEYDASSYTYDFFASEAILPGVNFDMTEMPGAYQGQLEYMPTRRIWPDVEITFYVDKKYNIIRLFEEWMNWINPLHSQRGQYYGGIHAQNGFDETHNFYKMRYPETYKKDVIISKFERDFLKNPNEKWTRRNYYSKWNHGQIMLAYRLIDAFPKQVTSVPVSYNGSTITQVTIVFGYTRYITIKDDGNRYTSRGSWVNYRGNVKKDRTKNYDYSKAITPTADNSVSASQDFWGGRDESLPFDRGLDWEPVSSDLGIGLDDPYNIWGQEPQPVSKRNPASQFDYTQSSSPNSFANKLNSGKSIVPDIPFYSQGKKETQDRMPLPF